MEKVHNQQIISKISSVNGEVVRINKIEREESPFQKSSSGNTIYKVIYKKSGRNHVAWYRANNVLNSDQKATRAYETKWIFE
jgi:hypothetical protein